MYIAQSYGTNERRNNQNDMNLRRDVGEGYQKELNYVYCRRMNTSVKEIVKVKNGIKHSGNMKHYKKTKSKNNNKGKRRNPD